MKKKIIYIDMDDVICDFIQAYNKEREEKPHIKYPQSQEGFFLNLQPIPQSIEVINKLRSLDFFDVYILTAPSVKNPLCYTEKRLWIERNFDLEMAEKLIISPNKGLNKGDYLIDDNIHGKGQEHFEGEIIHFGNEKVKSWSDVWSFFSARYGIGETLAGQ
ncbi:hypothetical protein JMN32_15915 [Fulvivirga sp. 29W222]|uniref:Uncharacterized protein n=1 Tax=Fulvivirga marina TaxID=2494733 RepID=A0A937G3K9_9BACT|nr:hypothetical protein [Fulvivirga marina]MBL6447806.1 hypothetical protein [Fulvivirga marina]